MIFAPGLTRVSSKKRVKQPGVSNRIKKKKIMSWPERDTLVANAGDAKI